MASKDKSNTQIELLFKAYKIGGLHFAIFILGSILLIGGIFDSFIDLVPKVDSSTLLYVSVLIIFLGVSIWSIEAFLKNRIMISLISIMNNLVLGAKEVSKTGGDYLSAIEHSIKEFSNILNAINATKNIEEQ